MFTNIKTFKSYRSNVQSNLIEYVRIYNSSIFSTNNAKLLRPQITQILIINLTSKFLSNYVKIGTFSAELECSWTSVSVKFQIAADLKLKPVIEDGWNFNWGNIHSIFFSWAVTVRQSMEM